MRTIHIFVICAAVAMGTTAVRGQPANFALISPGNGVELATPTAAVFTWQASSGATKYWLEILLDPTADWSTAQRVLRTGTTVGTNAELYGMIAGKNIWWRVQACNAQDQCVYNTGGVRSARIPLFPAALASPLHSAYTENRRPTFTWKRMSGAQYYKVVVGGQILTTGNGVQGNASAPAGTTYSFTPAQDLSGTFVDWSVQSCAMIGGGMLCSTVFNSAQTFRLNFGPPPPGTFKPDLGPGGPPGQFIPGGQVVAGLVKAEYVVNEPTVGDVPAFAKENGFDFQAVATQGIARCAVGFRNASGFSDSSIHAPMNGHVRFHLISTIQESLLATILVQPRCRFTLFLSKALQPGWRLKSASLRKHDGTPFDPWSYVVDQPPSGSSETATFSLMTTRSNVKVETAQILVLQRLVFAGPPGKSWQDAFRP